MTLGALEYIVVGFDHPDFKGAIADEIGRVIDAGIVRLVDAVVVRKDAAGDVAIVEVDNKEDPHFAAFEPLIKDAIACSRRRTWRCSPRASRRTRRPWSCSSSIAGWSASRAPWLTRAASCSAAP